MRKIHPRRGTGLLSGLALLMIAGACGGAALAWDAGVGKSAAGQPNADKAPAAGKATADEKARVAAKLERAPAITPAREAAALAFAQENHPDLVPLLTQLKAGQPAQYRNAVSDLFRTSERLATIKEREPQRHEQELGLWKLESRISLLSVRLAMAADPAGIEGELKELFRQRLQVRMQIAEEERARVQTRLEKLDAQIQQLREGGEAAIAAELDGLRARIKQSSVMEKLLRREPVTSKNPAGKKPAAASPPPSTSP